LPIPPHPGQSCELQCTLSELVIEDKFLELNSSICKTVKYNLTDYIKKHKISLRRGLKVSKDIEVTDIYSFSPETWCQNNLGDFQKDGRKMINYLYNQLTNLQGKYSELELIASRIIKLYLSYYRNAQKNLRQIEGIYGRRLEYAFSQQSEMRTGFESIHERLSETDDCYRTLIDEHDEKIETILSNLEETIDELRENIRPILEQLDQNN
jgi:hypothetical protein